MDDKEDAQAQFDAGFDGEFFAELERKGEPQVRLLLATAGLPTALQPAAFRWLTKKDQDSSRVKEASQAEQMEIARSAKDAAWAAARAAEKANTRATIALVIAAASIISSMVIGYLAWRFPHP